MPVLNAIRLQRKTFSPLPAILGMLCVFFCIDARTQTAAEYQVKAVFIYNFVNFVEWPANSFADETAPFVIGIAGENVFGGALQEVVTGETYRGRPIEIQEITGANAEACHILYISKGYTATKDILASVSGKPVLTIGDTNDFMQAGGMIRFFIEQQKIKIEINEEKATTHKLIVSAKLLRLAKIYQD